MARYRGSKNKLARREGEDLSLKTTGSNAHSSLLRRIKITPGVHGQKRGRKPSDYGRQLREKQKVKRIYGVMEKQFKNYYTAAAKKKGVTGEMMLEYLERRLDNVIYRLGFVPTRASARQLVRHGHVMVGDRRVAIPSYQVSVNDVVSVKGSSITIPVVAKSLGEKTHVIPSWLQKKATAGKIVNLPKREDIQEPVEEQLIVEYYSR